MGLSTLRSLYFCPVWHQLDGGCRGWEIISQPGCLCHSWGVRQPRTLPIPHSAGSGCAGALPGWQQFHGHCRALLLQQLPGSFPSLLLHNRSQHWILPSVFKGDFTPWGERGTSFDRFTIVWFVFSTAWAGNQLLRVIYCPNELPAT